jgi:hypothetical protein
MVEINWLAVVVGTVGYMVLGALWYGPLFGSVWMRSMGYSGPEDVEGEDSWENYALTALGSLVAAIALAALVDWVGATTWTMGLTVGLVAGVGIPATTGLQAVPFENRSWTSWALGAGYNVVARAGIGVRLVVL